MKTGSVHLNQANCSHTHTLNKTVDVTTLSHLEQLVAITERRQVNISDFTQKLPHLHVNQNSNRSSIHILIQITHKYHRDLYSNRPYIRIRTIIPIKIPLNCIHGLSDAKFNSRKLKNK